MKKFHPTKLQLTLIIAAALAIAAVTIYRYYTSPIHFGYYEPTYLPPQISITDKRISINGEGRTKIESASLRLETVAWSYSIRQFKRDAGTNIGDANQDFDNTSIKPTCSKFITPKSLRYRLCHWVDDWTSHGGGQVSVYEVKFMKGSTYFWGDIPAKVGEPIPVDEISKFIDSFERKSTAGVPVERSRYHV